MNMMYKELFRTKHKRDDGWLSELVSVNYNDEPFNCLHSYLVSIIPGKTRANHYHKKKEEWLAITSGEIALFLEDVNSREKKKIILDTNSEDHNMIYIPPLVAHAIKNIGENVASIVVFSKTPEDPEDTIPHSLELEE